MTMDKAMSAALMADFSEEQMGHKPATWCRACSDAVRNRQGKSCGEHKVVSCPKCKTKITEAHVCLTFVGHADVRARLCEVDPEWTWAPFEFPGTGSLILSTDGSPVGLWIHLTVGGVTKPGYGSVDRGKAEAVKELIGDALRNAGQSFGIAWKLWAKGERSGGEDSAAASDTGRNSTGEDWRSQPPVSRPRRDGGNGYGAPPAQPARRADGPQVPARPAADDELLQAWGAKIDEITDAASAMAVRDELAAADLDPGSTAAISGGIDAKLRTLSTSQAPRPSRPKGPPAEERGAQPVATGKGDNGEWVTGFLGRLASVKAAEGLDGFQGQISAAVRIKTISPAKAAELSAAIRDRRNELQEVPA